MYLYIFFRKDIIPNIKAVFEKIYLFSVFITENRDMSYFVLIWLKEIMRKKMWLEKQIFKMLFITNIFLIKLTNFTKVLIKI